MDGFYYHGDIEYITEILKNRLYFAVLEKSESTELQSSMDTYYFCTDEEFIYLNFYHDFGPLNISCLYKYCCKLNQLLNRPQQGIQRYVHYTVNNPNKKANACYLIGCYAVLYLNMEPKEAYQRLYSAGGVFKPFVDASQGPSPYTISVMDCFRAIKKCASLNFFNFDDFSVFEYDNNDRLANGDMNWLVPGKFLAFIGPTEVESSNMDCFNGHSPNFYIDYFLKNDIRTVIRLNNRVYNESVFSKAGIDHYDLFFPDGTIPPKHILLKFLDISEHAVGAIAVHCKAGLGRTGSLIGAFIVKHYHLTAREAIAWMRICRPGSVIGPQQDWLEKIEKWLWRQGCHYRSRHFGDGDKIPHHKVGIYSIKWMTDRERILRNMERKECTCAPKIKEKDSDKKRSFSSGIHPTSVNQKHNVDRKWNILNQKENELKRLSSLLYKVQNKNNPKDELVGNIAINQYPQFLPLQEHIRKGRRTRTASALRNDKNEVEKIGSPSEYPKNSKRRGTSAVNSKLINTLSEAFEHIPMTPLCSSMKTGGVKFNNDVKKQLTQGDKLNEIKMRRITEKKVQDEQHSKKRKGNEKKSKRLNC